MGRAYQKLVKKTRTKSTRGNTNGTRKVAIRRKKR